MTVDSLGVITATPQSYLRQLLAPPYTLPLWDDDGRRVEPRLNFGYVRADKAGIYAGPCSQPGMLLQDLGTVKNGVLAAEVPGRTLSKLIGENTINHISVRRQDTAIACGELLTRAPTTAASGRGSEAHFRILLRVDDAGSVELIPYYDLGNKQRISAANFLSLQKALMAAGQFGKSGQAMKFDIKLPGNDPLNPFKHKYNPDHDNLGSDFEPLAATAYESYKVQRKVTLILGEPPYRLQGKAEGEGETAAPSQDWRGEYSEVILGLHKNKISVRGYFIIRQVLAGRQLRKQDYDR